MMKFCSVIVALAFAILALADLENDLQKLENKIVKNLDICANETRVTGAQLDELGRLNIPTEIPPMCFLACMARNINIMDTDNMFSKDAIKKLMNPVLEKLKQGKMSDEGKQIMDVINKCVDEQAKETDECVVATEAMDCVVTNGKKAGILQ